MSKMGETQDPPESDSTDLNVFEVDSPMWLSSSDSSSQAGDLEDRAADVEDYLQKRRYTGALNPKQMLGASAGTKTDLWKCRTCGWTYPNNHPTARQKLEHKKHCKGLRDDAGLQDTDAGSDGSFDKQVFANADEEVVTQSGVRSAVAVSKSEDTSMDNLVLTNGVRGKDIANSRGDAYGHLGSKDGLLQHGVHVVTKQDDDEDDLRPSSPSSASSLSCFSSSSTPSASSEAVVSTVVEESTPAHHEPPVDGEAVDVTETHVENSISEQRDPLVEDEAVVRTLLHVEEAIPDNHERPADVEAVVRTVLHVEEAIPEHRELLVDGPPQASLCVQPSVNLGDATFCEDVDQATGAGAFHKEDKALGLSESSTNNTDSEVRQQEPAHNLENAYHSGSDSALQAKPDRHHAPDLRKELHSYIVESPRETLGWTEAGSSRDTEAYEVERVIRTQTTHDLICPYCRHNVTDRIILRKRKRTSRVSYGNWVHDYDSSSTQEEESLRPEAQDTAELDKDKAGFWGCLSCFTIFIPTRAEPQPVEAARDRAADVLEDSKESSTCLPLLFPPFKWKPAEIILPLPDGESVRDERPAITGTRDAPPDAVLDPASVSEDVEKASWLSCLPATLTSFEVPAPVVRIQMDREKESAPESTERPEAVGTLLVAAAKPLTTEHLEEEISTIDVEEPPSASPPVPAAKGKEYKAVEGVEIVEEHTRDEQKELSASEIVEVPDDVPATVSSVDFVVDQVEKASCLSFLPATLTSFDLPPRVEPQYKYTFRQIQDEGRASSLFEGYHQKDKSSCLSCLPATLTSWEFPSTPVLEAQTEDDAAPTRGERQEKKTVNLKAEVGEEGKNSCLSCLPVTFTSWEFPQTPTEDSLARMFIEEEGQVKKTVHLKGKDDGVGSEGIPARHPHLAQETETSCFSFIPLTFRSFDVKPKLKLPEIQTRISVPDRDLGKTTVHETVIQGSVTNTTAIEEPEEPPKTTDMSVTYFRTSIKVEEAKRRFIRKKLEPRPGDYDATTAGQEEGEENADEELGSGKDGQESTSKDEGAVIEGAPPPSMTVTWLVPPGKADNELCEPDYTKLESRNSAPTARPTPVKIDRSDWAELQVPLLSAEQPPDAEPGMTSVAISSVTIQVQGPDATDTLQAAVAEAENAGVLQQTSDGLEGLEIVKSIVYGGLDSTLTSLAVVASAAGAEAETITVVALGVANVIAGMITFFAKVTSLDRETFRSTIGSNLWVNGSVAALSFIIFGMAAPLTFGFTFRESNDKDYKVYATCAVAVVSIVFLGSLKAYVKRLNVWATVLGLLVTGFLAAVVGYFAGDYVARLLKEYGFDFESGENSGMIEQVGR